MDIPSKSDLVKIHDYLWEIPQGFRDDMRVPARIYASEQMLDELFKDRSLWQLVNLTTLPGIYKYALVMPDVHEGYGAPIGGVFAIKTQEGEGIISPGAVGYDVNCGIRLLRSNLTFSEAKDKIPQLTQAIYKEVPSGVGEGGWLKLHNTELDKVLETGVEYMLKNDWATESDKEFCESNGKLENARAETVSDKAKSRGRDQLGTIGAGNHFVEIQRVDEIFDEQAAQTLGLFKGQITISIHCGSRGLGHQVATDYIRIMDNHLDEYGIKLVDRELACAPLNSVQGKNYFSAMSAAANFAWANRQLITYEVRKAWGSVFGREPSAVGSELELVYDLAHNICKKEFYDGVELLVHRKGATRAFPIGNKEIPEIYAKTCGQPVLIPGSMGTASYVLVGTEQAMSESFGSNPHGAGRTMSRTKAKNIINGKELQQELGRKGIFIQAGSFSGLAEEAPQAYKDIELVVNVVHQAGIAQKVARLKPVGVMKG